MRHAAIIARLNPRGFTIIEILMIMVVLSIALPTLFLILGQNVRQGVRAELETTATNAAQALLEEIRSKRWDENAPIPPGTYTATAGPEAGEGRTLCTGLAIGQPYDDVDDYHGYSETCTWGGTSFLSSVAVCYVDPANLNNCVGLADYKRITVTVSQAELGAFELVTVVTNL